MQFKKVLKSARRLTRLQDGSERFKKVQEESIMFKGFTEVQEGKQRYKKVKDNSTRFKKVQDE